jgi:hypothetical protein
VSPDFDELVGTDLEPEERDRLRHAHDLLVAAGPLPELSPELDRTPGDRGRPRSSRSSTGAATRRSPCWRRRSPWPSSAAATSTGHERDSAGFTAERVIPMEATPAAPRGASASLTLGRRTTPATGPCSCASRTS